MTEPASPGLFSALRGTLATGLALLGNRLDLLGTELAEEKARTLSLLAWGAAALILLGAGLVFLAVFLTVLFWDSHRLLALGVFAALFLAGGGGALAMTIGLARKSSPVFAASLAELGKDREALLRGPAP